MPKKGDELHPILDLQRLNTYFRVLRFEMMTPAVVIRAVDLKDAYFQIHIYSPQRKFLGFAFSSPETTCVHTLPRGGHPPPSQREGNESAGLPG